jgi:hypothetical protein
MNTEEKEELIEMFYANKKEEAINKIMDNVPSELYRYCSINEYTIKNIEENVLWLSKPNDLNDPYDSLAQLNFQTARFHIENVILGLLMGLKDKKAIQQIKDYIIVNDIVSGRIDSDRYNNVISKLNEIMSIMIEDDFNLLQKAVKSLRYDYKHALLGDINNIFYESLKIVCFSETMDNILMWGHYCDSQTGICIEYDFKSFTKKIEENELELLPVVYKRDPTEYIEKRCEYYHPQVMIKNDIWKYENEWRMIKRFPENKIVNPSIKKIIVGPRFRLYSKNSTYNELIERLFSSIKKNDIQVYRIRPQAFTNKLDACSIDNFEY